jgi:hypothetical protein
MAAHGLNSVDSLLEWCEAQHAGGAQTHEHVQLRARCVLTVPLRALAFCMRAGCLCATRRWLRCPMPAGRRAGRRARAPPRTPRSPRRATAARGGHAHRMCALLLMRVCACDAAALVTGAGEGARAQLFPGHGLALGGGVMRRRRHPPLRRGRTKDRTFADRELYMRAPALSAGAHDADITYRTFARVAPPARRRLRHTAGCALTRLRNHRSSGVLTAAHVKKPFR